MTKTTNKEFLIVPDSTEPIQCKILHAKLKCQKTPKELDVRNLASKWDDRLCDPVHVSYRDGQYGIVEGQKRKLAKMMADPDGVLTCNIYRNLSEGDEYKLFSQLNNSKRTYGSDEEYEARAGFDPKWKYVVECIQKAGFNLVYKGGAKLYTFGCSASLEEIYDEMGDIDFIGMLELLKNTCDGNKYSLHATFVKGFSKFYTVYKTSLLEKELKKMFVDKSTNKISKTSFDIVKEKSNMYTRSRNVAIKTAFGFLMRYNEVCSRKNVLSLGAFDSLNNK